MGMPFDSKILADDAAETRVKERDGQQGKAQNDQSGVAVGGRKLPHVHEQDLDHADQQQRQAGEAETALADDQGEEEDGQTKQAPGDGDVAGAELDGQRDDFKRKGGKEEDLLRMAEDEIEVGLAI